MRQPECISAYPYYSNKVQSDLSYSSAILALLLLLFDLCKQHQTFMLCQGHLHVALKIGIRRQERVHNSTESQSRHFVVLSRSIEYLENHSSDVLNRP